MPTVFVNNLPVEIGNEKLNCIQAAEKAGVLIPHYCWHPALTVVASCRMCLVEVGEMKDGKPVMQPKVVPGCQTPVKDGTVIVTDSERAKKAQAQTLEGLLLNHPLDCPVCDKAGECKLQDYSFQFGNSQSRLMDEKNQPANKPGLSDKITLFTDRCIMCSRCVRFTREISGTAELQIINRGNHSEIDVFPGFPLDNALAGNVVDLCPVGALGSKDFLYKQRVWYLKSTDSVCTGCSTGCSIHVDANKDVVFRLRARENPKAQGYFMCDEGRYGYHYIHSKDRIARPLVRIEGRAKAITWNQTIGEIRKKLTETAQQKPDQVWGVLSPFLTCEEAFLAAKFLKGLSPKVHLALGTVPVTGVDDTYPKDSRGNPLPQVKFTIRAEKSPNRFGVEAVLQHFQGEVIPFSQFLDAAQSGNVQAAFIAGGYTAPSWLSDTEAATLQKIPLLVTSDLFHGPATRSSGYILPSASFAEKEGTMVNYAGLAQQLGKCMKSPNESRTEAQIFYDLLEQRGLIQINAIQKELAETIPYFHKLMNSTENLSPTLGVMLVS